MVEWSPTITNHTIWFLSKGDRHLVSINALEYAAIIFGLAGSILSWETLPIDCRPIHPTVLLWTDNTTAESWTKRIAGLSGPQGRALACLFAHLLMFSGVSTKAAYIKGKKNTIVDHLSHLRKQHDFSQFRYTSLVQQFPQLKSCHRFHPSAKLLLLVSTSLLTGSVSIPTARVALAQMLAE
jgi:hypothetical protein